MNSVIHFEIPFEDEERAKKFYQEAFGWQISDWPMEDGTTYPGIMTGEVGEDKMHKEKGVIGGGMVPKSVAQNPVITLKAENLEEAVEKAVSLGAEKLSEHIYPGAGKMVYLKDTEGNMIGLWKNAEKS